MKENEIRARIKDVLAKKELLFEKDYTDNLEGIIEELRTYQVELEFQNDELRRVQQELEKTENKYRLLFEQVPVGYVVINELFEVQLCNREAGRLMACNEIKSGRNKDFRQVIAAESQDDFYRFVQALKKGVSPEQFECVIINQLNQRPVPIMIQAVQNNVENSEWLLAIMDQSAQKRAEAALAQKELTLQTINQNMADMLVLSNADGEIEFASPASAMLGYTPDDMVGKSLFDFVYADDLALIIEKFNAAVHSGKPDQVEFRSFRKDGSIFWVSVSGNFVNVSDNPTGKAVFVVRDIDNQKMMEQALKESEQQFRSLFENNHAVMLLIDPDKLDILDANPAAVAFYGYSYKQLLEMKISDLNTLSFQQLRQEAAKAKEARKIRFDFKHRLANGTIRDVEVFSGFVTNDSRSFLYSIIHDVTDKKQAETKLLQNAKELHELNLTKDKLFSVIAHDLRNPVGLMLSLIDMYVEERDGYNETEKTKIILAMQKTAANTYELLENLLDWSRLQREKIKPVFRMVNINDQLEMGLSRFESAAEKKQIRIFSKVHQNIEANIDQNIFDTVFRNLMSNAIKFSNRGGKVEVDVSFNPKNELILRVKDNGIGMNEQTINQLFSLEKEPGRPGTAGEKSTGLGLVICKDFVDLIGGNISIESTAGKGTSFYVTFPQHL